jgi:two-component system sensor histidine kinase ComP
MANDIHDTTMQDLFFLKRRLHSVLSRSIQAEEDRQQMTGLIDYLEVINTNLRQSCFELHPHLLREIGLLQTLHKLIEQERAASPFEIELFTEHAEAAEHFNLDSKRHIFRITQELLNNAKKHSSANKVSIQLYCVGGLFYLSYEDDGIGFEPLFAGNETNLSGIGMEQMRSRILTMNGKLELISGVGSGVKITIELPMQEGMDT